MEGLGASCPCDKAPLQPHPVHLQLALSIHKEPLVGAQLPDVKGRGVKEGAQLLCARAGAFYADVRARARYLP